MIKPMSSYRVIWVIDLDAETPRDAAQRTLELQRDPNSAAQVFTVCDLDGNFLARIDLIEESNGLDPDRR